MAEKIANLEVLENRLDILEHRVFGSCDKDVDYPRDAEEIAATLCKLNSHVDSSIAGRPKIDAIMKRLGEMERYLDPAYTDRLVLSQEAKSEIILAEEEKLRDQAKMLEQVRDMSSVLSSEHLSITPDLKTDLHSLCHVHIQQQDQAGEVGEEVKQLLQHYNNVITLISKKFVNWDEILTKLEAAKQVTKVID